MTIEDIQAWLDLAPPLVPWAVAGMVLVLSLAVFVIAHQIIARGLVYVSRRTATKYDDIVVRELRPFRFAWIAPLLVIYYLASLLAHGTDLVRHVVLVLILWLVVITINSLLDATNTIFEASRFYRGEPIQGYLDLAKIVLALAALIVTFSLFTGESPLVLLSGLGAVMAVLLLVFRDTLLSFVASIQIQSNDLIKEGDWIEVPSYDADGAVANMALHTITIQNWDKTITVIPTYKLLDTPYKNWRGMEESGGRRIKRAIYIDLNCIRFCDDEMIDRFNQVDLLQEYMASRLSADGRQFTNVEVFQTYVARYLSSRPDLHQMGMTQLVRQLEPGPNGLPIEIYTFTRTTDWVEYESIQAEILGHLIATMPQFNLRIFQQPTGRDFQALASSL